MYCNMTDSAADDTGPTLDPPADTGPSCPGSPTVDDLAQPQPQRILLFSMIIMIDNMHVDVILCS